jgi:serine/threonine protein kinase
MLGRGGMGEVYRANDLLLGQAVALKFLPVQWTSDESTLGRFRNEVRIARQISHPNVCRVYDIGEAEGSTYLSMEYVDGEDLASLLRRIGRLPPDKALEIAHQLCAGLAAAHDKGVVHRDPVMLVVRDAIDYDFPREIATGAFTLGPRNLGSESLEALFPKPAESGKNHREMRSALFTGRPS